MTEIDPGFSFYDDPDYSSDADRDSRILQRWHQRLWSKPLPSCGAVELRVDPGSYLAFDAPHGTVRVSSDTIATTHSNYTRSAIPGLLAEFSEEARQTYERIFYTIGGFIIFPVRLSSLNQARGTRSKIADRFDLTLECIRQHYSEGRATPLSDVLQKDADYFGIFGKGLEGFISFVEFFHLQDLVVDGGIRWFDGNAGRQWDFDSSPLPSAAADYRGYLDNVVGFVTARNARIQRWCQSHPKS